MNMQTILQLTDLEPMHSSATNEFKFVVLGRGQQRGSKVAQVIYGRDGKPVTKNGRIVAVARDSNDDKSLTYMQEIRTAAAVAMEHAGVRLISAPIELTATFYFLRPASHFGSGRNAGVLKSGAPRVHAQSPDLAKLIRCLEDALTGVLWQDDKLVYAYGEGTGRKWTTEQERVEVSVRWEQ